MGDRTIDAAVRADARILWDYHHVPAGVPADPDLIIVAGSHDERVALRGAEVARQYPRALLVASGGLGKVTKELQTTPEAERFRDLMVDEGIPRDRILVERDSSNMGENIAFTKKTVEALGAEVASATVITKPYMERRALATAQVQWPDVSWSVTSPQIELADYPRSDVPEDRMIDLMVGDLQRIELYAEQGFQSAQVIPKEVWDAYERLVAAGFDKQVVN